MVCSYSNNNESYKAFLLHDDITNKNHTRFGHKNPLNSIKNNETVKNIVNNDIMKRFKHASEIDDQEQTFHSNNKYSYNFSFSNICRLRFKYLILRFLITFTVAVKLFDYFLVKVLDILHITYFEDQNSSLFLSALTLTIKLIAVYGAFLLIELARKNYLHVSFKKNSLYKIFSKFLYYQAIYISSFLLLSISLNFINKFYSQFETKTLTAISVLSLTTVYTTKHMFFDVDRLMFTQGTEFYQNPQSYIKINFYKKIVESVKLSILSIIAITGFYICTVKIGFEFFYQLLVNGIALRFIKYVFSGKQNQNEEINNMMILNGYYGSHYNKEDLHYLASKNSKKILNNTRKTVSLSSIKFLSLKQVIAIFSINFSIMFLWELLNVSFNAYLSIGPLHKGKLISLMSARPIDTLVDGLRNKNSFTRLTAYQELSLRSQLKMKGNLVENIYRNPIYNNKTNWFNILNECLKTIKETNNNIVEYNLKLNFKKDNAAYLNKLAVMQKKKNLEKLLKLQENEHLFGSNLSPIDDFDLLNLNNEYLSKKDEILNDNVNSVNDNVLRAYDDAYIYKNFGSNAYQHNYSTNNKVTNDAEIVAIDETYLNGNIIVKYAFPTFKRIFDKNIKKFLFPDVAKPVITLQPEIKISYDNKFSQVFRGFLNKATNFTNSALMKKVYAKYTNHLLEKDAQEVCPLPTVYAESVFSLCSLLIQSLNENPKSYVVSSINDILKTYQISSVILGEYCDLVAHERGDSNASSTSIEILYDIVLAAFLEVVVKYKPLLKDIELDEDVKNLIACVLE
ncbi:hypothetical protein QEN19_000901 [Hanseniaspora menglaensis]